LNGKVERSHRIDAAKVFNNKQSEWEDYHDYHRPTAASRARRPTNDYARKLTPGRNRWSAAHNSWCPH